MTLESSLRAACGLPCSHSGCASTRASHQPRWRTQPHHPSRLPGPPRAADAALGGSEYAHVVLDISAPAEVAFVPRAVQQHFGAQVGFSPGDVPLRWAPGGPQRCAEFVCVLCRLPQRPHGAKRTRSCVVHVCSACSACTGPTYGWWRRAPTSRFHPFRTSTCSSTVQQSQTPTCLSRLRRRWRTGAPLSM